MMAIAKAAVAHWVFPEGKGALFFNEFVNFSGLIDHLEGIINAWNWME